MPRMKRAKQIVAGLANFQTQSCRKKSISQEGELVMEEERKKSEIFRD